MCSGDQKIMLTRDIKDMFLKTHIKRLEIKTIISTMKKYIDGIRLNYIVQEKY